MTIGHSQSLFTVSQQCSYVFAGSMWPVASRALTVTVYCVTVLSVHFNLQTLYDVPLRNYSLTQFTLYEISATDISHTTFNISLFDINRHFGANRHTHSSTVTQVHLSNKVILTRVEEIYLLHRCLYSSSEIGKTMFCQHTAGLHSQTVKQLLPFCSAFMSPAWWLSQAMHSMKYALMWSAVVDYNSTLQLKGQLPKPTNWPVC